MTNSTSGQSGRGRPMDGRLNGQIMEAVIDLLAERGYAQLTTAMVAAKAGVSTATLYRRWSTKRDLLLAAAKHIADGVEEPEATGALAGDIAHLCDRKSRMFSGRVGRMVLSLLGEAAHDPELAEILHQGLYAPTTEHLEVILHAAAARGEHVVSDTSSVTHLLLGIVLSKTAFAGSDEGGALSEGDIALVVAAIQGT